MIFHAHSFFSEKNMEDIISERMWGVFCFAAGIATALVFFVCFRGRTDTEVMIRGPWFISAQLIFGIVWITALYVQWHLSFIWLIDVAIWCRMLWLLSGALQLERLLSFNFQRSGRRMCCAIFISTQTAQTLLKYLTDSHAHAISLELLQQDILILQASVYVALLLAVEQLLPQLTFYRPTVIMGSFSIICFVWMDCVHNHTVSFVAACGCVCLTIIGQALRLCGSRASHRDFVIYFWNKLNTQNDVQFSDIMDSIVARQHLFDWCSKQNARGLALVRCVGDINGRKSNCCSKCSACFLVRLGRQIVKKYCEPSSVHYIGPGDARMQPSSLDDNDEQEHESKESELTEKYNTGTIIDFDDMLRQQNSQSYADPSDLYFLEQYVLQELENHYFNSYLNKYSASRN